MANRTLTVAVGVVVVVAVLLAAILIPPYIGRSRVGGPTSTTTSAVAPPQGYTLVYARVSTNRLDPRSGTSIDILLNVYQTLTYVAPNGSVEPELATGWSSNPEGTVWNFTLRQGVTFHDGTPFNSTAVVFSINNTVEFGEGDAPDVWAGLVSVKALGPYKVQITWAYPANVPVIVGSAYSAYMFSPNVWRYAGITPGNNTALNIWFSQYHDDGSGPYEMLPNESSLQTGITLAAYPKYWGGWKPNQFTKVFVKFVSSVPTAVNLLTAGQINETYLNGQFQYVPQLQSSGFKVVGGPSVAAVWMLFNTKHPLLDRPEVRQALLTAINYEQLLSEGYYGYGQLFCGGIPPNMPFYSNATACYPPSGDIARAKQILASIGITGGLNATWTLTYSTGSPFLGTVAQILATDWAPLGVKLNIEGLPSFTALAKMAGYFNQTTGQVFSPGPLSYASTPQAQDIVLLEWWPDYSDPYLDMEELFAIQRPPYQDDIIYNWAYWTNQTFTELLQKAHVDEAVNPQLAQQEYNELNLMLYQAAPGWPLFAEDTVVVFGPHVAGYSPDPNYGLGDPLWYTLYYA